ncbi:Protein ccc1 [Recurvomyces mirabilis]|uniref:Protein ccc1 n=1 Tax=Recurvomyces mirabilis TaxID=574656 RepID=A0AAE1C1Z6_9PEZI|nr:Protein ccc1 [Recurvomyces mirabilis]KAK5157802.1 Protein ccc1 [Recurvomyces mirabilis]
MRSNESRYSRLPTRNNTTTTEFERGTSRDSGVAMSDSGSINEKIAAEHDSKRLLPTRMNPRIISDATIGLSDGLTVPFALTAGLSALGDTNVVIYGGLAELIAGGISMGLGGYLGAKSEAEAYQAALSETKAIVAEDQQTASSLVRGTFTHYDFSERVLDEMTESLRASPPDMVDFLMRFHHQLTEADYAPSRAYISGLTIALGYVLGGLVALLPYLFMSSIQNGFYGSVLVMAIALFAFGWAKTSLVGEANRMTCLQNGMQMLVLGAVAAGAAMGCVKAIG